MSEPLRFVLPESVVVGWDFSTGSLKCLAFGMDGQAVAQVRFPTDLWHGDPPNGAVCELSLMQLEGQARASVRAIASELKAAGRINDWIAGGISATHHTAGRIDRSHNQVRRAICWNDQTLAAYRARGERRLGGAEARSRAPGWSLGRPLHVEPPGQGRRPRLLQPGSVAANLSHSAARPFGGRLSHGPFRRDQRVGSRFDGNHGSAESRLVSGHAGGVGLGGEPPAGLVAIAADRRSFRADRPPGRAPGNRSGPRPRTPPPDLSDLGRSAGGPCRRRRGRQRPNGRHPGQLGRRQFVLRGSAALRSLARGRFARRDAFELGPLSLDALLQQRRTVPRPSPRSQGRLEIARAAGPPHKTGSRRGLRHAVRRPRAVAQGRGKPQAPLVAARASRPRPAVPSGTGSPCLSDRARGGRARKIGPDDHAHHGLGRDRAAT